MLREPGSASEARARRVAAAAGCPSASSWTRAGTTRRRRPRGARLRSRAPLSSGSTCDLTPGPPARAPRRAAVAGMSAPTIIVVPAPRFRRATCSDGPRRPAVPGPDLRAQGFRAARPGELASLRPGDTRWPGPAGRRRPPQHRPPHPSARRARPGATGTAVASAEQAAETLRRWIARASWSATTSRPVAVRDASRTGSPRPRGGWVRWRSRRPGSGRSCRTRTPTPPRSKDGSALLAATATDLEPIVLAHDPEPEISDLTEWRGRRRPPSRSRTPTASGTGCGG